MIPQDLEDRARTAARTVQWFEAPTSDVGEWFEWNIKAEGLTAVIALPAETIGDGERPATALPALWVLWRDGAFVANVTSEAEARAFVAEVERA